MDKRCSIDTRQQAAINRTWYRRTKSRRRPAAEPPRWALAREVVRHVGEPVVAVIAETAMAAIDAGERVVVDYEPLPAVTASNAALANGAVQLHADAPGNVCFRFERGDAQTVATAIDGAPHVIRLDLTNNRLAGAALEPRTLMAVPEPVGESLTLYAVTQVPHHVRKFVAEQIGMAELHLRVVAPDVGGGFGYKGKHYPEETLIVWAARRLRRPVRWRATRGESFVSDTQARDHLTHAELALDANGTFVALRVETMANIGAYVHRSLGCALSAIVSNHSPRSRKSGLSPADPRVRGLLRAVSTSGSTSPRDRR